MALRDMPKFKMRFETKPLNLFHNAQGRDHLTRNDILGKECATFWSRSKASLATNITLEDIENKNQKSKNNNFIYELDKDWKVLQHIVALIFKWIDKHKEI